MPATVGGWRHLLATLIFLATSCAALHAVAVDGGDNVATPNGRRATDQPNNEQGVVHTCTVYYRLDDVTEMNDEIRRCLIHPGVPASDI